MWKELLTLLWLVESPHTFTVPPHPVSIPVCEMSRSARVITTSNARIALAAQGQTELIWFKIHPNEKLVLTVYWNPISGDWTGLFSGASGWSCKGVSSREYPKLPPSPYQNASL